MKKSVLSFVIMSMLFAYAAKAQDCVYYFPTTEGASVETSSYDAKGTLTGTSVQRVVKKEVSGDQTTITIASDTYLANGTKNGNTTFQYYCKAGVFYLDMKKILDPALINQYKDKGINIKATDCAIPGTLTVGEALPETSVTMEISDEGVPMMAFKIKIYNRKVEAVETVKTNMGDYQCYKVAYDVETNMGMIIKTKGAEWYAKNVGTVKTEYYDAKGKLMSYTLMTKFKDQ